MSPPRGQEDFFSTNPKLLWLRTEFNSTEGNSTEDTSPLSAVHVRVGTALLFLAGQSLRLAATTLLSSRLFWPSVRLMHLWQVPASYIRLLSPSHPCLLSLTSLPPFHSSTW